MKSNSRRLLLTLLAAVIAVWIGTPAFAQDLLVTGQTTPKQADNNDGIPGPVAVGDDGTLQLGLPFNYEDTGLTIIDHNTGLEWEKKDGPVDDVPNFANLHDVDNFYHWSGDGTQETIWDWLDDVNAEEGFNAEGFAGHNDWRIPNIRELESIVHYGKTTPAIDPIFGPTANHSHLSSSSDTSFANIMRTWRVNFENGKTGLVNWNIPKWVRAVRTASAAPPTTTTTLPPTTTTTLPPTTTTTLPPTTTTTLPPPMVTCNGLPATIVGTNASETIIGTAGNDVIHGLGGNDLIDGLGGADVICGGNDDDSLFGNSGRDQLFGENGNDAMDGGPGVDLCNGGPGTDTAVNCESTPGVP